jgi:hypothetical protein
MLALLGTVALIGFTVIVSRQTDHADWLLHHGARTPGRVVGYARGLHGDGSISVIYIAGGIVRRARVALTETSADYLIGQPVTVIYDPSHPSDVRTPKEQNLPSGWTGPLLIALVIGFLALIPGLTMVRRGRRWRPVLRAAPWRPYRARFVAGIRRTRFGRLRPGFELVPVDDAADTPVVVRLRAGTRARAGRLRDSPCVWLAGELSGRMVLALPSTRELFDARVAGHLTQPADAATAEKAPATEDVGDEGDAQVADQAFRTLRACLFVAATQWLFVAGLMAITTTLPTALILGIALLAVTYTLLIIRSLQRRHHAGLDTYVNPLTGELAIPGQRLPLPPRIWIVSGLMVAGEAATLALLAATSS